MSDFKQKLDALPEWPDSRDYVNGRDITTWEHIIGLREAQRDAALARLELAREWIAENGHGLICNKRMLSHYACTCGRDVLLKKMKGPHE